MKRSTKRILKKFGYYTFIAFALGFSIGLVVFIYYYQTLPDVSVLVGRRVSESTKIFDRTGEVLLFDVHGNERRTIIPWEKIPETVRKSSIVAEDDEFYKHHGIDFKGILRAFYINITKRSLSQGGSTITQQLIKNSLFGQEKTISRKIREAIFAIKIERELTKDQILWMYLNQIPYGSNIYGIEAASEAFFGVHAIELTTAQAALLSSLPKAPTYYSPYGDRVEALMARKDQTLLSMQELGFINEDEYHDALREELKFLPPTDFIEAPHFVMMVREYLINKYGEDTVQNGGLRVITTLDFDLQQKAETVVTKYGESNVASYGATNMALVSADPQTGHILAMVGSRNYFDVENEGNFNVARALRQPGSSFKPFAYATAFDHGFTDSTILFDLTTEFNTACSPDATSTKSPNGSACYNPHNYDFGTSGPVTMRQALARSLNIPAVKTLYLAGIPATIETATRMGITTLTEPDRYGLSLVLGGAEVKLVDMVSAFGTFANDGIHVKQTFIQQVTTNDGRILEEYEKNEERSLDRNVSRLTTDILSDNNARAPVFGFNSPLYIPGRPVAGKTGTTQNNRDGWLIGFTPSLVTGVWTGNNNNTPMHNNSAGVSASGPAWKEYMINALAGTPIEFFPKPEPTTTTKTMLNGEYLGPLGIHSILFYVDPKDPQGTIPSNPYANNQYSNWEYAVEKWASRLFPTTSTKPDPQPLITPTDPTPSATPVSVDF